MSFDFCHITPTAHLNLTDGRRLHLVLAHLIESDPNYLNFYLEQKDKYKCKLILDNSAFELYKRGLPMYPSDKLIEMGNKCKADWIVMTDYPGEPSEKTIESAKVLAPEFHKAGFKTFFVPQSRIGDPEDLIKGFKWAVDNHNLVDYIGISILAAPNAFGVERGNKMQRFNSRMKLMYMMKDMQMFYEFKSNHDYGRVHYLGMVDGPNEIMFMWPFCKWIDSWDSSSAVWTGLNGISYDDSPTGLINGKFELEVDFDFVTKDKNNINIAKKNMDYIDRLGNAYLWGSGYDKGYV